jgi:hypothetical protein
MSDYNSRKKIREEERARSLLDAYRPLIARNEEQFDALRRENAENNRLVSQRRNAEVFNKNVQLEDINANQGRNNLIEARIQSDTEYREAQRDILRARAKLAATREVSLAKQFDDYLRPFSDLTYQSLLNYDAVNRLDYVKTDYEQYLPFSALSDFGVQRLEERSKKLAEMIFKRAESDSRSSDRLLNSSDRLKYQDLYRAAYNNVLNVYEGPDSNTRQNLNVGQIVFYKARTLVDSRLDDTYGVFRGVEHPYRYGIITSLEDPDEALIMPINYLSPNQFQASIPGYSAFVRYKSILPIPKFDQVQTKLILENKDFASSAGPYEKVVTSVPDLDEMGRKIIIPKTSRQMIAEDSLAAQYFLSGVAARKDEVVGVDSTGNPIVKDKPFPVDPKIYIRIGEYLGLPDPGIVGDVEIGLQHDANFKKALTEFRTLPRPLEEVKVISKGIKRVRDANYKEVPIDDPDFITEDEADEDTGDTGDAKRQKTDE